MQKQLDQFSGNSAITFSTAKINFN